MGTRRRIGIALGSGAARGWAHIGIIEALGALGIVPDIVCGTSIGALVGAAFAAGKLSALKARVADLGWREIAALLDLNLTAGGLIEGKRIENFLKELGISGAIDAFTQRFGAVATDLATGQEVWLQQGPIERAVRASIGIPGVFSPARREDGDSWLLDGGLVNPVPVSLARALGADIVIAVDLNMDLLGRRFVEESDDEEAGPSGMPGPPQIPQALKDSVGPIVAKVLQRGPTAPSYFEVLANSLNIMQDRITRARLAGEPPHILLTPHFRDFNWLDFHRSKEAVAEGYACVERAASTIRHYCPTHDKE